MLKKLFGSAEALGWSMASLVALLVITFWTLHMLASGAPAPLGGFFGGLAARASGQNYGY